MFNTKSSKNLRSKSESIVNVFTKTVNELETINNQASAEIVKNKEVLDKITQEIKDFEDISKSNSKIINKINEFLK